MFSSPVPYFLKSAPKMSGKRPKAQGCLKLTDIFKRYCSVFVINVHNMFMSSFDHGYADQ